MIIYLDAHHVFVRIMSNLHLYWFVKVGTGGVDQNGLTLLRAPLGSIIVVRHYLVVANGSLCYLNLAMTLKLFCFIVWSHTPLRGVGLLVFLSRYHCVRMGEFVEILLWLILLGRLTQSLDLNLIFIFFSGITIHIWHVLWFSGFNLVKQLHIHLLLVSQYLLGSDAFVWQYVGLITL